MTSSDFLWPFLVKGDRVALVAPCGLPLQNGATLKESVAPVLDARRHLFDRRHLDVLLDDVLRHHFH